LLEDVSDASGALRVAERFQAQLCVTFEVDSYRIYSSASIGILVGDQGPSEKLVRAADLAMYQAKRMGKARSVVFDPNSRESYPQV
jgi:GGDEF domain-containing protein